MAISYPIALWSGISAITIWDWPWDIHSIQLNFICLANLWWNLIFFCFYELLLLNFVFMDMMIISPDDRSWNYWALLLYFLLIRRKSKPDILIHHLCFAFIELKFVHLCLPVLLFQFLCFFKTIFDEIYW